MTLIWCAIVFNGHSPRRRFRQAVLAGRFTGSIRPGAGTLAHDDEDIRLSGARVAAR